MSTTAARRAEDVLRNAEQVVAIEILGAVKGLWVRRQEAGVQLGRGTLAAVQAVEEVLGGARTGIPSEDLARLVDAVREGRFVAAVEAAIGPLAPIGASDA